MTHNRSDECDKIEYRELLFPYSVSPTYDNAANKLADFLHSNNVSINDKLTEFEKFTQIFTTGHEAWQEWNNFQLDKLNEDGIYSREKENEVDMKENINFFRHFPVPYRCPKGSINSLPYSGKALSAQLNHYLVCLKTLSENDFNYEHKISDVCDTFWYRFPDKINSYHAFYWFEINITSYAGFKNLPEIEKYLKIYHSHMLLDAALDGNDVDILKKKISLLKETEDSEYITKNIQVDMAYYNTTEQLKEKWEILFHYSQKYVKETNGNQKSLINLLEVYRRYCRYFVDDLTTRKKYQEEIAKTEELLDNTKWILDSIKIEFDFGSKNQALKQLVKFAEKRKIDSKIFYFKKFEENFEILQKMLIKTEAPVPMICFTKNGMIQQNFAFQSPLIKYICINAKYECTQKLQKSSKQLFLITNKTLCFKFSISELQETEIFQETLFVSSENPKIDHLNNICIFNTLFVSCENESDTLSKFIPKIQECSCRFLLIRYQNLTLVEYNFLTNSKNIKRFAFDDSVVKDLNGRKVSLEELMKNLPNAENIGFALINKTETISFYRFIPSPLITAETFFILQNFKRNVKIQNFYLSEITEKINSADLCLFFKIHASNKSKIEMYAEKGKNLKYLLPSITNLLNSWKPLFKKPTIEME